MSSSSLAAWVQGPYGTAVITVCALAAGLFLGAWLGLGRGLRRGYEDALNDEAEAWQQANEERAMWHRAHRRVHDLPELHHEWDGQPAPASASSGMWQVHVGQALAITAEPFDVDAIIAGMHADVDRFLAGVVDKYRPLYPETGQ